MAHPKLRPCKFFALTGAALMLLQQQDCLSSTLPGSMLGVYCNSGTIVLQQQDCLSTVVLAVRQECTAWLCVRNTLPCSRSELYSTAWLCFYTAGVAGVYCLAASLCRSTDCLTPIEAQLCVTVPAVQLQQGTLLQRQG